MTVTSPTLSAETQDVAEPVTKVASAANLSLALKFALRELRGGLSGFYVFLACIALGVAAISGVNSVAQSITSGIAQEGKTLLGGDIAFRTVHRKISPDERSWISAQGKLSEAATMRAMARLTDVSDQSLIKLKAVDASWPLDGTLITKPEGAFGQSGVVVEPILLTRLGLELGDAIKVGSAELVITGTIEDEPDRVSDGISFGPKVIINLEALAQTKLVQPGSLINWTTRVNLTDGSDGNLAKVIAEAKSKFPDSGWRIRSRANAAPSLTRNVERFSQFLTLVGLTALIVGGVGVANAVRAFLDTKSHVIASFKSLGAPARFVFSVYLIQILLLALVGVAIGLVVGAALPIIAKSVLADILPVGSATAFHPSPGRCRGLWSADRSCLCSVAVGSGTGYSCNSAVPQCHTGRGALASVDLPAGNRHRGAVFGRPRHLSGRRPTRSIDICWWYRCLIHPFARCFLGYSMGGAPCASGQIHPPASGRG